MLKQGHHRVGVEEMELARLRLGILCISPFGRNAGGGGGGPSVLPWRELSGEGENDRHTVSEELQRAAVQLLQKSLLRDHHMRIETQTRFTVV